MDCTKATTYTTWFKRHIEITYRCSNTKKKRL